MFQVKLDTESSFVFGFRPPSGLAKPSVASWASRSPYLSLQPFTQVHVPGFAALSTALAAAASKGNVATAEAIELCSRFRNNAEMAENRFGEAALAPKGKSQFTSGCILSL